MQKDFIKDYFDNIFMQTMKNNISTELLEICKIKVAFHEKYDRELIFLKML